MVASAAVAGVVLSGLLVAPHLLPRKSVDPTAGILLFGSALALRAAFVVAVTVILVLALPSTPEFGALSSWCLHAVVPYVSTHLGLNGHAVGHAAVLTPPALVLAAFISAGYGVWRACREVRGWLRASSIGAGPEGTLIVGGSRVVLATSGIRRPQVLVSAGALLELDDAELHAGLEHERGHVKHGHRFISLGAVALYALARVLPGSRAALDQLMFHLERDADEYALRRTNDPDGLARAIEKAALPDYAAPAMTGLGSSGAFDRIQVLGRARPASTPLTLLAAVVSALLVATAGSLVFLMPALIAVIPIDTSLSLGSIFGC